MRFVTRLSQFDFRRKLKTWAYRIAVNYILDVKKSPVEKLRTSFDRFAEYLTSAPEDVGPPEAEHSILIEEVKIACTFGMLQCLDRPRRVAYVLGEIWEIPAPEAAVVLDISPELFRKRFQFARAAIVCFMKQYCGLVLDTAACRCNRQLPGAVSCSKLQPAKLDFAAGSKSFVDARAGPPSRGVELGAPGSSNESSQSLQHRQVSGNVHGAASLNLVRYNFAFLVLILPEPSINDFAENETTVNSLSLTVV